MSIENDLKRIADSLEKVARLMEGACEQSAKEPATTASSEVSGTPVAPPAPPKSEATGPAVSAPTPPAPPTQGASETVPTTPPAPPAPATDVPAISTPEELNAALVEQFKRLGSRDPIDQIMRAEPFCAQGLGDLTVEQYGPLIEAVKKVNV